MEEEYKPKAGCLRRRSVGKDPATPNHSLDLNVGFRIVEGSSTSVIKGTPSPCSTKMLIDDDEDYEDKKPSSTLMEFRKKQQSFEIHIEDCDEEEFCDNSDDEGGPTPDISRPHTPAHILQYPDHGGNIVYKEQPPQDNFLRVGERDTECVTDVSEGESDNEVDTEDDPNMPESVIKRVPM